MNSNKLNQKISDSSIVVAVVEQISSDIGDEIVILNFRSGVYHSVNEVGGRIWTLIKEPKTVKDIKEILLQEYKVEAEICDRDLTELLLKLQASQLIEISHETTT
ncbi:PqqD family protein [Fortiea sp. LEGE XX443]|uniref:PqqD family peptide modification chaperone n=1 Tax=Fortiea sp. LEGE XX443 TaxID=1828611 RepID=UPI001881499E|nr:PqqD family peptide modification chaperone [Fortiea sp. LEGE XX443]MBE9005843.1 PqqD family protein [Fortiea sp. LEGE XX443]